MVEIEAITIFEIGLVIIAVICAPILGHYLRHHANINKKLEDVEKQNVRMAEKLDNLIKSYNKEVEASNKQHERMEGKIDDLCTRVAKLEK